MTGHTEEYAPRLSVAAADDAAELLDIYAPYVEKTAITFEYDVPGIDEFQERITNTLQKYPYIVARQDGQILGYAYTHAFVGRAAYDHAAETTIYLREGCTGAGIGRMLYEALERISLAQNIFNLNACIGVPEKEDEHLTMNSIRFHEHMGYRMVGTFHNCGYKFGTWYHMAWMEKIIGAHEANPAPVIPFPHLDRRTVQDLLAAGSTL